MRFDVQVDGADALNAALIEYTARRRSLTPKFLRKEARLLLQRVSAFTPPASLAQGRRAVHRDVDRGIRPLDPRKFESARIQQLIRAKDYQALQVIFSRSKSPDIRRSLVVPFSPAYHQDARRSRGRVRRPTGHVTPDWREQRKYRVRTQKGVGQAKGGWASALIHLGGKPPKWVRRHVKAGKYKDVFDVEGDGYFTAINRSRWASGGDEDRIVSNAMRTRARDIRRRLAIELEREKRKAGLK